MVGVLALLAAGADRTAKEKAGKTAFDVAGSCKDKLNFYAAHNTPSFVFVCALCAACRLLKELEHLVSARHFPV